MDFGIHLDVTAKTVSEEYTPLHLAARIIIPPRTTQESAEDNNDESDDSRVEGHTEADGGSGPTRQISSEKSTMEYLLKNCKGVDVGCNLKAIILDDMILVLLVQGRPIHP